jgi:DNA phosphorothioation-dependent restriction protein DptH
VWRVADLEETETHTITADRAVEMRESKGNPILLLVDTLRAGAGMDGIYSAAREVKEKELFDEAIALAAHELTVRVSRACREFAKRAVKKARGRGRRVSVSPWTEFDFYTSSAIQERHPGAFLYMLGLWPIQETEGMDDQTVLHFALLFVNHLLGSTSSGLTPAARIETLRFLDITQEQRRDLEVFLFSAAVKPLLLALNDLADKPHLWINSIKIVVPDKIKGIELLPWRNQTGRLTKWSGLTPMGESDEPPVFILHPDADRTGLYSKLEIRWKAKPENLEKGAAEYRVIIVTDMDEELASREITHSAKKEEKCQFTNDDFPTLSEDALISAKIVISVTGDESIEPKESEDFIIRFGEPSEQPRGSVGRKVRAFSGGLIELEDRDLISTFQFVGTSLEKDVKGYIGLRTPQKNKSFRVFRPSLIYEVEKRWVEEKGAIGRWRVKVRTSGARAGSVEFIPFIYEDSSKESSLKPVWERAESATRRFQERLTKSGGGVGQIYDEKAKEFDLLKEYLLAWAALLGHDQCDPVFALTNTVEVQTLSGKIIGLIVLPTHPLRVAWHVGYDNLVFHTRFEQGMIPRDVREELEALDGSMFPAFLPGLNNKSSFVFVDTLGFHAVGMVLDSDKEPKASLALLSRALGENETAESAPTVGKRSAEVLGKEIIKYLECHERSRLLQIHALRPGDGLTMARALGNVYKQYQEEQGTEGPEEEKQESVPAFVLELYPSEGQQAISGRFIAEACEKRRTGAGILSADDLWMLESLPAGEGVNIPRLRWARRIEQNPKTAAHLAAAFDTFESRIDTIPESKILSRRPLFAFGLLSFFERQYTSQPSPLWLSYVSLSTEGEKHPSDRIHTERLLRIQQAIHKAVVRNLGGTESDLPVLRTEITPEKAENLRTIHDLCDWVITVDRNAGIEYFDSPRDNSEIYEAYVIDCVPEREDLGCLQMITSTSNLEEVRNLLDTALEQLGLSRSLRNAKFLMWHLKALSGRLAIRLTGQKAATGELIALALVHANCRDAHQGDEAWTSLTGGFFVPVDDVLDLLPPLRDQRKEMEEKRTRPDLIHIFIGSRGGLGFRFVEVKYRRHLRTARSPEDLEHLRKQTESLRERWWAWYFDENLAPTVRATRRAKLARVLRFYADKGRRHYLDNDIYQKFIEEIDKMVSSGNSYSFGSVARGDRGFVFCPEYSDRNPLEISPENWETRIFLFGPGRLPDLDFRSVPLPPQDEDMPPELSSEISAEVVNLVPGIEKTKEVARDLATQKVDMDAEETKAKQKPADEQVDGSKLEIVLGEDVFTAGPIAWDPSIRSNPHLLVVGLSGTGKTTCLIDICWQLWNQGVRPIVFSYHPDIDERLLRLLGSVRFVDYSGLGFNPLRKPARESRRTYLDVAGEMRDIFLAIFPDLGDIQGEAIRQAIKQSYLEQGWGDIALDQDEFREPEFGRFFEIIRDKPKPDRGMKTLLLRLEELADYGFFISGEDRGDLWESMEPIVIRVHTTQNENLQRAFASLLFYGFYKGMFYRKPQDKLTHFIVIDEAHRASRLKLIPTMAQECRKFGIGLILASQKAADFQVSIFSLFANYLVLRLTDNDARALVRNVAGSDQERSLIDRIKQMEIYRGLFFSEGRRKPTYIKLNPIKV